jgi:hypothetical protein
MDRSYNVVVCTFVIGLLVVLGVRASPTELTRGIPIAKLVKALGSDGEDLQRIKLLAQQPVESARLLVAELHPVTGVRILSYEPRARWEETLHVIWCLHALRYITGGLEFRARTAHDFGSGEIEERRKWFVGGEQFRKDRSVRFFGVWMSRDSTYIAPRDAQIEIIRKWKASNAQHGKTFAYVDPTQDQSPDVWYF